jgi:SAM-dependent methyltransferase
VGEPVDAVPRTAASYDLVVDQYEALTRAVPREFESFRSRFVAALPPGAVVVDLGCGPGRDLECFERSGLRSLGIDLSVGMAHRARGLVSAVARADLRVLPVQRESVDGLWCAASLLHAPRSDVARTLAEWNAALHPDGVLGLNTSIGTDEGWELVPYLQALGPRHPQLRRWFVHHKPDDLLALLRQAMFQVEAAVTTQSFRTWLQVLARKTAT